MEIHDLDCAIVSAVESDRLYAAGFADTRARTFAGPGFSFADAFADAMGENTSARTVTYTLANNRQGSQSSYGIALAYAYGADDEGIDFSYSVSASLYRATSYFGHITTSGFFRSGY